MSWNDVETKATEAQIKKAEKLLEEKYGEVIFPIYDMNRAELSKLIDELQR